MAASARTTSPSASSKYGKSHPITRMPLACATGRSASRNPAPLNPSTDEPVRTKRCVRPVSLARATIAFGSPPSAWSGCQIHIPLPDGTTGVGGGGGGGGGGAVVVGGAVVDVVVGAAVMVVGATVVDGA